MRIASINIKNFKFFINETCEFKNKNILLYGENGSGKSSLYYALYRKIKNKQNIGDYKNRSSSEDIEIDIRLTDNSKFSKITPHKSYFINHSILTKIINTEDFFSSIINIFFSNFENVFGSINAKMTKITSNLKDIRESETLMKEIYATRKSLDEELKDVMEKIQITSNEILKKFEENSNLSFERIDSRVEVFESIDPNFTQPKINIKIDNTLNLKGNFNEATLKLSALAIFFALIEMDSSQSMNQGEKSLKVLLFDDILLSVDMGNRIYITKYICENYQDYQKIILTHSLSFFEQFEIMIRHYKEEGLWLKQILYKSEIANNKFEAKLYDKSYEYLDKARKVIEHNQLESAGNYLRKELEKSVQEIIRYLQIGKKDKLETLLKAIIKKGKFFLNSQKLLEKIIESKEIKIEDTDILETEDLNKILKEAHFLKDIILNKTSHSLSGEDLYRKELEITAFKIEKLKDIVKSITGETES